MSSWWSALNPFVEVRAEEAHEEEDEKDSKEAESGTIPILTALIPPNCILTFSR
jgi:hypothetical protein